MSRFDTFRGAGGFVLFLAIAMGLAACTSTGGIDNSLAPADAQRMAEVTQATLEGTRVGESVNWSGGDGKVLGTVTPIRTFQGSGGKPCRDFQRSLTVDGRTQVNFGTACREASGVWVVSRTRNGYDDGRYPSYDDEPCMHCGFRPGFRFGYGHRLRTW